MGSSRPGIGVLAIQGDFEAHAKALDRIGACCVPVRHEKDLDGRLKLLRARGKLFREQGREGPDLPRHGAKVANGLDDVAATGLSLRADHGRTLADASQRLA